MNNGTSTEHDKNAVYSNDVMTGMISSIYGGVTTNNLGEFKKFIDNNTELKTYSNDVKYTYNLDLQIYSSDSNLKVNPSNIMQIFGFGDNPMMQMDSIFNELTNNKSLLNSQYDIVAGKLPSEYNELVLIIDDNNEINDYALYSLGIKDQKELEKTMSKMMAGEKIDEFKQTKYTYEDILNIKFRLILNSDYYVKENGIWIDKSNDIDYLNNLLDNSIELKIVGIIKPSDDSNISITNGIGYTSDLTEYVVNGINDSEIGKEQIENKDINVFTGREFENLESYDMNLTQIGMVDLKDPYIINIYPKDFESKDEIERIINEYNDTKSEEDTIE